MGEPNLTSFELRQYTLFGGQRDTLISLFEREFIETQDEVGAHVLGTFRDLDDPDRFVWMRGFETLDTRAEALGAFYGGPVWQRFRNDANATMVDSDNVLLLQRGSVALRGTVERSPGVITANIHYLGNVDPTAFSEFFDSVIRPLLEKCGARPFASFLSETAPNNFPRLPVREHDIVFMWLGRVSDAAAQCDIERRFAAASGWRDQVPAELLPGLVRKPEVLRLQPTAKSPM